MHVKNIPAEAIKAYLDQDGFPILQATVAVPDLLKEAFEDNIETAAVAQLLSHQLVLVSRGEEPGFVFQGNSCSMTLLPDQVIIENDISPDEEPIEMSCEQYGIILDTWTALLDNSRQ